MKKTTLPIFFLFCFLIGGENRGFIDNIESIKSKNETKFKLSEKNYEAKETKIPPKIDGKLDDDCWKNANELSNFLIYKGENEIASIQTHVKITFTKDTIYVGFICNEPNMKGLIEKCREYDGNVWYDDCVEIWFDVNCKKRSYHILVNPLGTIYDQKEEEKEEQDPFAIRAGEKKVVVSEDRGWNSGAIAKVFKGENFWSVELAVPVKNFGIENIIKGSIWGLNVGRTRRSGNVCELSSWTGVFCTPINNFGVIKFEGSPPYIIDIISMGNLSNGENNYSIRIKNIKKEKKYILWKIEAVSNIKSKKMIKISLNPGEEKIIKLPYKLEGIGEKFYMLIEGIEENTGEKIYYDRIDGRIPELLILNLLKNELYLGEEKRLEATVKINLGDRYFENIFLELELLNAQNEIILSEKIEKLESPFLKLGLNISFLKEEGDYKIRVKVVNKENNKILVFKEGTFILIKPPF